MWKFQLPHLSLSIAQTRILEQKAILELKLAESELMERAGLAAFEILKSKINKNSMISVFCGPGNNGGDGFVLARHLKQLDYKVQIYLVGHFERQTSLAKSMSEICSNLQIPIIPYSNQSIGHDEIVIDAMLGIGLKNEVKEPFLSAINTINSAHAVVYALDCPSGLDADSGKPLGTAIKATSTVSFIGLKNGLFLGEGLEYSGEIYCASLDLPESLFNTQDYICNLTPTIFSRFLQARSPLSHKGHFGHVLIIGGDYGFAGAPLLAGMAALRTGAGLVSIATRPEHISAVVGHCPELMCHGIKNSRELNPLLAKASVLVVGPGLGQSPWSKALFQQALKTDLPMILDADGLNLLAEAKTPLTRINWILTPHPGEAARLLKIPTHILQDDRLCYAKALQSQLGGICILKGAGTLIASADHPIACSLFGNASMAKAGSGDVLSGTVAGILAQQKELIEAAYLGTVLHGLAGDLAVVQRPETCVIARDLIDQFPQAVKILSSICKKYLTENYKKI